MSVLSFSHLLVPKSEVSNCTMWNELAAGGQGLRSDTHQWRPRQSLLGGCPAPGCRRAQAEGVKLIETLKLVASLSGMKASVEALVPNGWQEITGSTAKLVSPLPSFHPFPPFLLLPSLPSLPPSSFLSALFLFLSLSLLVAGSTGVKLSRH